ncbi:hypothetical protein V5N11_010011 [Cardamine amara subsp. amara]|uniref:Uncharacterized protein n=1 Tax=Cardamine amara subsp. amara TaxID=228776 RepID=A0ABD1CA73_CARAN
MLLAGPLLWVIGSIHNSCQIYERADSHVQILQQCVHIPFLVGSLLFLVSAVLNFIDQSGSSHSGLKLLGRRWVWLGISGAICLFLGGLMNVVKVFNFIRSMESASRNYEAEHKTGFLKPEKDISLLLLKKKE